MTRSPLGMTGLFVSRLGFGTGDLSPGCDISAHAGAKLLVRAFERGITFWDTANNYDTYEPIRLALRHLGRRGRDVVISSKIEAMSERAATRQIDRALQEIRREPLELMLLHCVNEPLSEWDGAIRALERAQHDGKVRFWGLTTHRRQVVMEALRRPEIAVIGSPMNPQGIWIENQPKPKHGAAARDAMGRALARAKATGKGVFIFKALGAGALAPQKRQAIRWAMGRPYADAVCLGMSTPAELEEILQLIPSS